jgi:hypothetical protein
MKLKNNFGLLFLLTFLVALKISAQNEYPIILNYENSSGEKGISFFEYDGTNRLIKGWWQLLDSTRYSTNFYFYNSKNQLVEKYREFSDSLTSSVKYTYNKKGWKIAEDFTRSDGISGKSVFEYNKKGALQKIVCNKFNGWFDGEIHYKTGKNQKVVSGEIFRNNQKLGDIEMKYSANGNLISEKWITPNWSQTFTWEYKKLPVLYSCSNVFIPENNRFRLVEENYLFNDKTGGPSFYTYNNQGKLTEKTFVRSDGLKTSTTFLYRKNGLLKKSFRKYNSGKSAKFQYSFNKNRKLGKRNFKNLRGKKGNERYFYDELGLLKKAVWNNFDHWISGEIVFDHKKNGQVKSGKFYGKPVDANILFEYDKHGNLISIFWHFADGNKQEYQFKYIHLF